MSTSQPPKILAIGSPNSSLKKLVSKINAFQTNYGPFECCVIIGNLFKKSEDGSSLTPDLEFPIPTYFTSPSPSHPLPPVLKARLARNPEVLPNLIYLGKNGVFKTRSGVGVGFVGGSSGAGSEEMGIGEKEDPTEVGSNSDLSSLLSHPSFLEHTLPSTSSSNPDSNAHIEMNINPTTSGPTSQPTSVPTPTLAEARKQALKAAKEREREKEMPSRARGLDVLILMGEAGEGTVGRTLPGLAGGSSGLGSGSGSGLQGEDGEDGAASTSATKTRKSSELDTLISLSRPRYILLPTPPGSSALKSGYAESLPFGWTGQGGGYDERWTRVVRVDRFAEDDSEGKVEGEGEGEKKKEKGEKKKFFYAFSLPDLVNSSVSRPETVGPNPFVAPRGMKRGPGGLDGGDDKRSRTGEYVCRICNQPGHNIRDCPEKGNKPRPPPPEYTCHRCNQSGHWIQDCPELPPAGVKKEIKMLTMDECWFCLANTNCDTRFIAAVQNDTYVALSKGQLIKTGDSRNPPMVPGGAHLLIIPIQHIPNPLLLPEDEARPLLAEINQIKDQVRQTFAKFDAVPVFCDMYRNLARAQHGQIQAVPVPKSRAGELEGMFRKAAKKEGWKFEDSDAETLLKGGRGREFIKLDLPDGKSLVHFIQGKFNLQFARQHLADFLGTPDRANWQVCVTSDEQVKRDVNAFKKAFTG